MPRYLRFTLLLTGFVPYAFKLPYMLNAWKSSPQDRYDWIYILLFAVLFPTVWMLTRKRNQVAKVDFFAMFLLIPALAGYGVFLYSSINAGQILCGIGIAFSIFWLIYGGQNTYRMLPVFALLALGVTSTTFWINYYISSPDMATGLLVKATLAIIMLLWLTSNYIWEKKVTSSTILFAGAVCMALFLIWLNGESSKQNGQAVILKLSEGAVGPYLASRLEITPGDIRFFGSNNQISKYYYANDTTGIFVLALAFSNKVNSIHPASHCLRSSGWTILSDDIRKNELDNNPFYVDEIISRKQDTTCLLWVWYTNNRFSTGNFMYFRRKWTSSQVWHTYQVMIPMQSDDDAGINKARQQMKNFLQTIKQK